MSRMQINKLLLYIDSDEAHTRAYAANPADFLADWEARAAASHAPDRESGTLTDEERRAFVERDWGALYGMGSHPYLLLHAARAVDVGVLGVAFPEFDRLYKLAIAPYGYPDFHT
jgi:hypothetical protein